MQCPVYGTMSSDERQHVQQLAEYLTFAKGQTVIRERDEIPQGLWMLQRGKCQVVKELSGGAEQQLALLEPGAIFGEMSFFDPSPHSATVRAVDAITPSRKSC
jgi:CRP/FNR family transcriptional regulator, cyclic AMP receptor protein